MRYRRPLQVFDAVLPAACDDLRFMADTCVERLWVSHTGTTPGSALGRA